MRRYADGLDNIQEIHDKLSAYLASITAARICALTSPAEAEAWGQRTHSRSLRASGVRMVSEFTPETRQVIERYRAEGAIR